MLVHESYCLVCKKETRHCDNECSVCEAKAEKKRISKWKAMSTDKKLDDLRKRVEDLEQGPTRY
jgi:hypothetical protein